jgi:poly(A) polymerase
MSASPERRRRRREREDAPRVVSRRDILPLVDQDAMRVISRLSRNGFEAYLVGGCVRDLLLGRRPKDFDVATAAHPRQVKRLFRNGRIIGRRFRLVHVVYGDHIVETATFRREPRNDAVEGEEEDLLIIEDNEYGTAEEDARRRDFTVNALFLDPIQGRILDWVNGLEDLEAGLLRTIGDPDVRLGEDPVRIIRAVKFATRLGFRIEEGTWRAMRARAEELARSAPPRVMEEIFRLLGSGTALGALRMMRACGALGVLLPEVDRFLGRRNDPDPAAHDRADTFWRLMEALDNDVHAEREPSRALCLAVVLLRVVESRAPEGPSPEQLARVAADVIEDLGARARISRRILAQARFLIANQPRFTMVAPRSWQPELFLRAEGFAECLQLFRLRSEAWGQGWDVYEGWVERHRRALELSEDDLAGMRKKRRRRGRSKRRGGRRGPKERAADADQGAR